MKIEVGKTYLSKGGLKRDVIFKKIINGKERFLSVLTDENYGIDSVLHGPNGYSMSGILKYQLISEYIDPGEGWRLLDDDEKVEDGDQYFSRAYGDWQISDNVGYDQGNIPTAYRRKITPPEPELPEGYEFCGKGEAERICGLDKVWMPWSMPSGGADCLGETYRFCRKIKPEPGFVDVVPHLFNDEYSVDADCMSDAVNRKDFMGFVWEENGVEMLATFPVSYRDGYGKLYYLHAGQDAVKEVCKAVRFSK